MTLRTVRGDIAAGVGRACSEAGLPPTMFNGSTRGPATLEWVPDLSVQDQATVDSIIKLAVGATLLTKAERDALEGDINTLRLYDNAASPTNAQTVAAVKSIVHVLRAFVRD